MKATFKMQVPPRGGEPVLYVDIDPDDTGLNVTGHEATENDKSRFAAELAEFEEGQKEKEKNGEPAYDAPPPLADLPVSVKASLPLGREDEYAAQYRGGKPIPVAPQVTAVAVVDPPPQLKAALEQANDQAKPEDDANVEAASNPLDMTVTEFSPLIHESTDVGQLKAWRKAERNGANRVGVINAIDSRLGELKRH